MCYNKGDYKETSKRNKRIDNVTNVYKHNSVLEFTEAIFDIEASSKTLLEMTRHRHANYAVKSSRYTLDKSELVFEKARLDETNETLDKIKDLVIDLISELQEKGLKGKKLNDEVSLLLPQAYQYKWTVKFNYRALQNFLKLRLSDQAHFHIQEVAEQILLALPKEHRFLFDDIVNKESSKEFKRIYKI